MSISCSETLWVRGWGGGFYIELIYNHQIVPLQFSIGELQNIEDIQFQICQECGETIVGNMAEGSLYKSGQLCSAF